MAMRNWWITGDCDGRKTDIGFGPNTAKDAGFTLNIWQRDNGSSVKAATVQGYVDQDGKLRLLIDGDGEGVVYRKVTER